MLKVGGRCGVVVPNGQDLFNKSSGLVALREYLVKTCDLKEIIHIPSGVFNSTDIKTCIFYFVKKKEGGDVLKIGDKKRNMYNFVKKFSTEVVKFYDYDCDKKEKKLIVEVGVNDIANNGYSFNYMDYVKKEEVVYGEDVRIMRLGDVCTINNGKNIISKQLIDGPYYVIGGGKSYMGCHNTFNCEKNTITISKDGAYAGYINFHTENVFVTNHGLYISAVKLEDVINKYIYYYLHLIRQTDLYKLQTGSAQPGIHRNDVENLEFQSHHSQSNNKQLKNSTFCTKQ